MHLFDTRPILLRRRMQFGLWPTIATRVGRIGGADSGRQSLRQAAAGSVLAAMHAARSRKNAASAANDRPTAESQDGTTVSAAGTKGRELEKTEGMAEPGDKVGWDFEKVGVEFACKGNSPAAAMEKRPTPKFANSPKRPAERATPFA